MHPPISQGLFILREVPSPVKGKVRACLELDSGWGVVACY